MNGEDVKKKSMIDSLKGWQLGGVGLGLAIALFSFGLLLGFSMGAIEGIKSMLPATSPGKILLILVGTGSLAIGFAVAIFLALTHTLREQLHQAQTKATDLSITDELTGLITRRHFYDRLDQELDRCRRYGTQLALIMIDIDNFKTVNDELGHPLGDVALVEVARLLKANIRTSDIIARYGGEEFAILVPAQGKSAAIAVAEKLRTVVEVNDLTLEGPRLKVTVSAGVTDYDDLTGKEDDPKVTLIRMADNALIRAKKGGRNRVEFHLRNGTQQYKLI